MKTHQPLSGLTKDPACCVLRGMRRNNSNDASSSKPAKLILPGSTLSSFRQPFALRQRKLKSFAEQTFATTKDFASLQRSASAYLTSQISARSWLSTVRYLQVVSKLAAGLPSGAAAALCATAGAALGEAAARAGSADPALSLGIALQQLAVAESLAAAALREGDVGVADGVIGQWLTGRVP